MDKPTDEQIINAISQFDGGSMTYVVANRIRRFKPFKGLKTDYVRRRLMKMEKAGLVRRVPSLYKAQYCWALPEVNHG